MVYAPQTRAESGSDLTSEESDALIVGAVRQSTIMQLARKVQVSSRTNAVPVQTAKPVAGFTGTVPAGYGGAPPDYGMGGVSKLPFGWSNLVAEEIMVVVPIANALLEDETYDLDANIRAQCQEAIARVVDDAALWGVNRPSTWSPSIIENIASASGGRVVLSGGFTNGSATVTDTAASAADVGKTVIGTGIPTGTTVSSVVAGTSLTLNHPVSFWNGATGNGLYNALILPSSAAYAVPADEYSTTADLAQAYLRAAMLVDQAGYDADAIVLAPGGLKRAELQRTTALQANPLAGDTPFTYTLAGMNVMPKPLRWSQMASAIVGDWNNSIIGIRRDVKCDVFTSGTVVDPATGTQWNLISQDMTAYRFTARFGFMTANPPVDTNYQGTPNSFAMVYNTGVTQVGPVGVSEASSGEADSIEWSSPELEDKPAKAPRSASRKR